MQEGQAVAVAQGMCPVRSSSELDDFGSGTHSMNMKGWSKAKQARAPLASSVKSFKAPKAARLAATLRPENMLDTVQQWRHPAE